MKTFLCYTTGSNFRDSKVYSCFTHADLLAPFTVQVGKVEAARMSCRLRPRATVEYARPSLIMQCSVTTDDIYILAEKIMIEFEDILNQV